MTTIGAVERLERDGSEISRRVIAKMYADDPFWLARFGEAGRRHADDDAGRHIEHLAASMRAGGPSVFVGYARWLQSVLTTRGMCTRHIADNFTLLAEELERSGFAEVETMTAIILAGRDALGRCDGSAGEVFRHRASLVRAVIEEAKAEASRNEADHLVVYLADALANGTSRDLVAFVIMGLSGRDRAVVDALVRALRQAVTVLQPNTVTTAQGYIDDVLRSLS
jgi:hypothetical protein